jgi:hypothetical protein
MMKTRRWTVVVLFGLLAPFVVPEAAHPLSAATTAPACGRNDLPETGTAGDVPLTDQLSGRADQGYNCGLALVGYSSLGGRGSNANMAWSQDCAYIAGDGVAVVDVRDPAHPKVARTLHTAGSDATVETIAAIDAPGRKLLATGRYGVFGVQGQTSTGPVDIWDVSDCLRPKLNTAFQFPANVHNLTFTANGKRLWSTLPLQAADLTDLRHPKMLPDIESQIAASGSPHLQYAHEAWPSPDDKRLYIGGQEVGDETLLVVDTDGWPRRPARALGGIPHPGHSIRPATIQGDPYLIASDESIINPTAKGCLPDALTPFGGASRPDLVDISHEDLPKVRSTLIVGITQPLHCPEQVLSGVNASVHYQDVDDPDDTTFAMVSAWNAGLRIFDVRHPSDPEEVAYFNPGRFGGRNPFPKTPGVGTALALEQLNGLDQAWAHIRYRADTGQIWLTTATGGFWVLELEPQVRAALDLPARPAAHPQGSIPRPAATHAVFATLGASEAASYCALSTARVL